MAKARIDKWLGLATAVSPYVLPPGGAVKQNNLQLHRPGELNPRPGMESVYTAKDYDQITGIYRVSSGGEGSDSLIAAIKRSAGTTQINYLTPNVGGGEFNWNFTTVYTATTTDTGSPTFAEDRHGRIHCFMGNGVPPIVIERSATEAQTIGLPAPMVAPLVTPTGNGYFIERVDVTDGGGSYWAPPPIVVSGGGSPIRPARLKTIIQGGSVVAVDVVDGGTGYTAPPLLAVNETGVKGAGFVAYGVVGVDPGLRGFEPTVSTTGNITNLSTSVTNVANISALRVGMTVVGTGIPANATVAAINTSTNTFTLSSGHAATVTATAQPLVIGGGLTSGTTNTSLSHAYDATSGSTSIAYKVGSSTFAVAANFDSALSVWSALIPLTSGTNVTSGAQSVGSGAFARVLFTSVVNTLSYQLGGTQDAAWPVLPTGAIFGTTANTMLTPTNASPYTATDYWRDTDDNTQYQANNTLSISRAPYQPNKWFRNNHDFFAALAPNFVYRFHKRREYEGMISGGNAFPQYGDVYTFDYSRISFRYFTGSRAELGTATDTADKWVWTTALVSVADGQPYIDVELLPAKKTGTTPYATYAGYQTPIVRIYLKYCPSSWLNTAGSGDSANACNLGWQRTGAGTPLTATSNLGWWSSGAAENGAAQVPIVDFRVGSGGSAAAGIAAGTVSVIRAGTGMEQDTFFAIQFDQVNAARLFVNDLSSVQFRNFTGSTGNPYKVSPSLPAEYTLNWSDFDINPVSPAYVDEYARTFNAARVAKPFSDYRQRFYFRAAAAAPNPEAPPGVVSGQPTVLIPGSGYVAGDRASFTLRQRSNLTDPPATATFTDSTTYTFRAVQITPPSQTDKITSVTISSQGTGYYGVPDLVPTGGGGYGLKLDAVVSGGGITAVNVIDGGAGWTSAPAISASAEKAAVLPVLRPSMRGTYRCAYRFADWTKTVVASRPFSTVAGSSVVTMADTSGIEPGMIVEHSSVPFMSKITSIVGTQVTLSANAITTGSAVATVRDMTKPIYYSNFSPITDVDTTLFTANPNPTQMVWSVTGVTPPSRATVVEFFRTSGDQSLVFYRLEMYGKVAGGTISMQGTDILTDEELFSIDRPFYAAVPVVLPNGNLNAYRFGVPRSDMSVCAAYGDRMWYGCSTSGEEPNTIFFSEFDEFESCPDINSLPIQNNQKSTDSLTALIPFSTFLLAMQSSHCYALSYNTDPTVDANINMIAHRGLLAQQCHDLFDDRLFGMDERGIYVMDRSGDVESLSDAISDLFFDGKLDLSIRKRFFLKVDQRTGVLRAFVALKGYGAPSPHIALCYKINTKVWWTETWPNGLTCSCDFKKLVGDQNEPVYGAVDGDVYRAGGRRDYQYRSISSVAVTNGGSGYTTQPTVGVASGQSGCGAEFVAILRDGAVSEILISEPGFGYGAYSGETFLPSVPLVISAPASGTTATASATATLPILANDEFPQATVAFAVRTGAMELSNDSNSGGKDGLQDRSVTVTYRPTETSDKLFLREYFNNATYPRSNVMPRDRGTGFVHDTDGAKTSLDMISTRSPLGVATGVAKAQFAGRSMSDMGGADRHVAVELSSPFVPANSTDPAPSQPLLYAIEVSGVTDGG